MIGFTFIAQRFCINEHSVGRFECARGKMPKVWWKQPGPTEDITCSDFLDKSVAFVLNVGFQGDFAFLDEIKTVCRLAFTENHFVGIEVRLHRTIAQNPKLVLAHPSYKWMRGNDAFGGLGG